MIRWYFFGCFGWCLFGCGSPAAVPVTVSATVPAAEPAALAAPPVAPAVAPFVDMHVDTPTQMVRRNVGLDDAALESGLDDMCDGGTNVVVEVLWPPREPATPAAWAAQVERLFSKVEDEDKRLDGVALARTPTEARAILAAHQIAMLVSIEGAHGIEAGGVASLAGLHARGLSLIGLTWTFSNHFAGSSGDAPPENPAGTGLTEDGRALVAAANALGVVIDVSHASDMTTMEVCALSSAPVIASHSDADGVQVHARNLSDAAIRCIAQKGGVIGLNFHATFVGRPATIAKVADHADYLRKIGGAGVVALGSDYDGLITTPTGLTDAGDLPALWDELRRRGWSDEDIRGVQGDNFMRAWQAVLDHAAH